MRLCSWVILHPIALLLASSGSCTHLDGTDKLPPYPCSTETSCQRVVRPNWLDRCLLFLTLGVCSLRSISVCSTLITLNSSTRLVYTFSFTMISRRMIGYLWLIVQDDLLHAIRIFCFGDVLMVTTVWLAFRSPTCNKDRIGQASWWGKRIMFKHSV